MASLCLPELFFAAVGGRINQPLGLSQRTNTQSRNLVIAIEKMLRVARTAEMRKLQCGAGRPGERLLWAVHLIPNSQKGSDAAFAPMAAESPSD